MHRPGHYGVNLLAYAPLGFVLLAAGLGELAVVGAGVAVAGAMLPDLDQRLPGVSHRGPTHTVWFALAVGAVLGLAGVLLGARAGPATAVVLGLFGAVLGVVTVGAHLLADLLTPAGVRPFAPVRPGRYTLDITKAKNPAANYALLALGVAALLLAFVLGVTVADLLGV